MAEVLAVAEARQGQLDSREAKKDDDVCLR